MCNWHGQPAVLSDAMGSFAQNYRSILHVPEGCSAECGTTMTMLSGKAMPQCSTHQLPAWKTKIRWGLPWQLTCPAPIAACSLTIAAQVASRPLKVTRSTLRRQMSAVRRRRIAAF
jgi:hypothetical protein